MNSSTGRLSNWPKNGFFWRFWGSDTKSHLSRGEYVIALQVKKNPTCWYQGQHFFFAHITFLGRKHTQKSIPTCFRVIRALSGELWRFSVFSPYFAFGSYYGPKGLPKGSQRQKQVKIRKKIRPVRFFQTFFLWRFNQLLIDFSMF